MKYIQQVTGILVVILFIFNCIDINAQVRPRGAATVVVPQKKKPYIDKAGYLVCVCELKLSKVKYGKDAFYYDPCPRCKKVWKEFYDKKKGIVEVPPIPKESKINYNDDPHKIPNKNCLSVDSVQVNDMKYYTFKNNCHRKLYIIILKNGEQNSFKILSPHVEVTIEWEAKNDLKMEQFHDEDKFQRKAVGYPEYPHIRCNF